MMMLESKDILSLTDAADCSIAKQFPRSAKHLQKAGLYLDV